MKNDFSKALADVDEIQITVTGRKTGRSITLPIWFVVEGKMLFLLPIKGSRSSWYQNVVADREVHLSTGEASMTAHPRLITNPAEVEHVLDIFRGRYGAEDVDKYYTDFDAALGVALEVG